MLTEKDLDNIKHLFDERFEQIDERFEQMDERFEQMDKRFEQMDERLGHSDERMDGIEGYMHKKFILIENDLIPKVNALYEAMDLHVKKQECRERHDALDKKMEYIEPLVEITKAHSEKINRYEEIIKELLEPA